MTFPRRTGQQPLPRRAGGAPGSQCQPQRPHGTTMPTPHLLVPTGSNLPNSIGDTSQKEDPAAHYVPVTRHPPPPTRQRGILPLQREEK